MSTKAYDPQTDPAMQALYESAVKNGLWFYTAYHDLWFSPDELHQYWGEGRYCWGPAKEEAKAHAAQRRVEAIKQQIGRRA